MASRAERRRYPEDNLFGTFGNCPVNGKHFIHNIQKGIKSKLKVMMPIDGRIPMQNLLQDLGVRNQALTLAHELFQQPLGISLVGTGCTDQIHGDVGINQDHG
jgi:hypothetical protein